MKTLMIIIGIILIVSMIATSMIPAIIAIYNGGLKLNNNVTLAYSNLDAVYKKQYELVDNLTNIAKSYGNFEKETLTQVIAARYTAMNSKTEMSKTDLGRLMVAFERYPDLKTHEQYTALSKQLVSLQDEIMTYKQQYNLAATEFNNHIIIFPNNIIAKMAGWKSRPTYSLKDSESDQRDAHTVIKI